VAHDVAIAQFVGGPLPKGVSDVLERLQRTEGVTRIAVMPDVHVAAEFCVGTVVASDRYLFPNAVGGDIGCGMLAMQFDGEAESLADADVAARLLGALMEGCPGRRHHRRAAPAVAPALRELPLSHTQLRAQCDGEAVRTQAGTLGAGNHFLELQSDDVGGLWLMIHTGSRHLGQVIHHHHLARAVKLPTNLLAIPVDSDHGRDYLMDVAFGRAWAQKNRRLLATAAARVVEQVLHISPKLETLVDCDHNHVTLEGHEGRQLLVHRKGATAAHEGQAGIVPGSMATASYHTCGLGNPEALCSSSHGAGRLLSRVKAREQVSRARVREQLRRSGVWYAPQLEESLREESPTAYKPIEEVMRAQSELTRIVRRLRPVLVHKGN
jgi:tRNA-splicing ligase RtcB